MLSNDRISQQKHPLHLKNLSANRNKGHNQKNHKFTQAQKYKPKYTFKFVNLFYQTIL